MRLSTKHPTQQTIVVADFSGGLNKAASLASIGDNELADVLNMELDSVTNRLKTVSGTVDVLTFTGGTIFAAAWDEINGKVLLVDTDKAVYASDLATTERLGTLTGGLYPICASWEDGLLIASGGKLQYYNGKTLETLTASPDTCRGVYIRSGRVVVFTANEVHYSAVGDETNWTEDSNDAASSVWVEAGYKDGGQFIGMASLSADIIILKNNRRVYRLSGEFPNWQIAEISRNVECVGRRSFDAMADNLIVLGKYEVQALSTTQNYGAVKPQNIASKVVPEVSALPLDAIVRYIPSMQQVWAIGTSGNVLVYDVPHGSWFKRRFNSDVVDVVPVGDAVYIIKPDRISKLSDNSFMDSGKELPWRFIAKQMVSQHDFLLKRTQVTVVPCRTDMYNGQVSVGAVVIGLPLPSSSVKIWHNRARIYNNRTKIHEDGRGRGIYASGEKIYKNPEPIYGNHKKIFSRREVTKESRNVYRNKYLSIKGYGNAGGFILNGFVLDIVEV